MGTGYRCGYCSYNEDDRIHAKCPGYMTGRNDTLIVCACTQTDKCGAPRCRECGNRQPDEISDVTGHCTNRDDCKAGIERRRREWLLAHTRMTQEDVEGRQTVNKASAASATRPRASKPTVGACLCCGAETKGGKFRPGHDSKWLTEQANRVQAGESVADLLAEMEAVGVSDALRAKFSKRVAP